MQKKIILIIILLLINCSESTDSNNAEDTFEQTVKIYDNCKTNYEKKYKHKPIIDIRNATQISGLAKDISDYLRENCYNTFYGNWNNSNSDTNTYIIIDNMTQASLVMIEELKIILGFDFDIDIRYPECNNIEISKCIENQSNLNSDIILIIGHDYQK
tara:strand:+ start:1526 stop:1999 length:474 start_codon:yes stop_codon:yes gene_type:complete